MKTSIRARLMILAIALLFAAIAGGCSKRSGPMTTHNLHGQDVPMPTNIIYLGVVELSDQTDTRLDIQAGKSCVLRPTIVSPDNLKIDVVLEESDSHGSIATFSPPPVNAKDGKRFAVSVGDICFALTPKLKTK